MAFTKITGPGIHTLSNIMSHNVKSSGIITAVNGNLTGWLAVGSTASFGGDVTVGGTLTYDDVTNIDSVGLITARAGIHVGAGGTIIHAVSSNAGQVLINAVAVEGGTNTKLCVVGSGTPNTHPSTIASSTLATFRMTGGLSHAAGISIIGGNTGSSVLNFGDRDSELIGRIIYNHTTDNLQDYMDFYVQGDDKLRITAGGDVGIGTVPARRLSIFDTDPTVLELNSTNSGGTTLRIQNNHTDKMFMGLAADFIIGQSTNVTDSAIRSNSDLLFATGGGNEKVRFESTGDVGIGTTNPSRRLHVADFGTHGAIRVEGSGNGNRSGIEFYRETSAGRSKGGAAIWVQSDTSSSNGLLRFGTGSNAGIQSINDHMMVLDAQGDLGIGTDSISQPVTIRRSSVGQAEFGVRFQWENLTGPAQTSSALLVGSYGLKLKNYNSSRNFLFETGEVGIGTNDPIAPRFSGTVSGLLHLRGTKPSFYVSESDNHDPDGKERAIYMGLSGGSAFIGSNGDDGLTFSTGNGATGAAIQITEDKYVHFGNTGHGTNKVGGQAVTGNDFDPYFKILSNTNNSWSMQVRNDTNTGSNGIFLRAGNDNDSTYTLYATGVDEHSPSFIVRGDGKVGIGTNAPQHALSVFDTSEPTISLFSSASTKRIALQYASNQTYLYSYQNSPINFSVGSGNSFKLRMKLHPEQTYGVDDFALTGTGAQNTSQAYPTGVIEWQNNTGTGIEKYNCYIQATAGNETDMYITIANSGFYRITIKASHNSTSADVAQYLIYGLNSQVTGNRITEVVSTGSFSVTNHNTHVNTHSSTVKISYSSSANQGLRALVEVIGGF